MKIFWKVEWHPHPAKYGVPWCTPKRDAFRDGEGGGRIQVLGRKGREHGGSEVTVREKKQLLDTLRHAKAWFSETLQCGSS